MSEKKVRKTLLFDASEKEIDNKLFEKIKTIQSLPDDVVHNFLKSKGSLRFTRFKNKFFSNARQS